MSMVEEGDEWIDIRPTASATADDLIMDHRHRILRVVQASIWADDQSKWKFALFQQGVVGGNSVQGAA